MERLTAALLQGGAATLAGGAVVGAAGTSGFMLPAVPGSGPVVLWADGDVPGALAALRLGTALRERGRVVAVRLAPDGSDWADIAALEVAERGAVREL